jgi:hypothetical protein
MVRNVLVMQSFTLGRRRSWLCATFSVLLAAAWLPAADDASWRRPRLWCRSTSTTISSASTRAEDHHDIALVDRDDKLLARRRISDDAAGLAQLLDLLAGHGDGPEAAHGGGWLPLNFHDVCDANAADFSDCMSKHGSVEDTVFGQFLDWLVGAGQPGGGPAGVVVKNLC